MEIDFTGLTELTAKLEALGPAVEGPGTRRAIRAGARVIRDAMQAAAPVLDKTTAESTALPPGSLKAGMRIYVPQDVNPPEALAGPSAKVEHVARWVEYGHRSVKGGYSRMTANGKTRGPGKAGEDVPAHPFLRPAFEESIAPAIEAMKASLTETIQETVT